MSVRKALSATLQVFVLILAACGASTTSTPVTAPSAEPTASATAAATASARSAAASIAPVPATGTPCPAKPRADGPTLTPFPAPIAPFVGDNGASKVFAYVESVDAAAGRVTVTFPSSATGPLATSAAPTQRATLRVTPSSVLQDVVAREVALAAPVTPGSPRLTLSPGAPAVPARAPVIVLALDVCNVVVGQQRNTLAQAAPAGASEWLLATLVTPPPGRGAVVVTELVSLTLRDLAPGDMLLGPGGAFIFGLTFSGPAPDFVLTRLVRACRASPCPLPVN